MISIFKAAIASSLLDGEGESDGFVVTDDRGLIVFGCVDGVKHSEDRNIVLESEGKEIKVVFDEDTDAENFVWTWFV